MNIEDKNMNTCPGCDKHCPIGQFECGKGRRLLGHVEDGFQTNHVGKRDQNHREGSEHRHSHHDHNSRSHPDREEHHGNHHKHGYHHDKKWWSEGDGDDLSVLLEKCGHHLTKRFRRGHGQERILQILSGESSISQRKLQEILDIKPGSISEILAKLEDKELIVREKSESDRRAVVIHITEKGKASATEKADMQYNETPFDCLEEEERETLRALLKKLLAAWCDK